MRSSGLSVAPAVSLTALPLSEKQSIATYDALAHEYDSSLHRTTRELERLSGLALAEAGLWRMTASAAPLVLELGCGTGALTVGVLSEQSSGCLLITDPAPRMLRQARERLSSNPASVTVIPLIGTATEVARRLGTAPTAIIAGLADPYLSSSLLKTLVQASDRDTLIFVTVPSLAWASTERGNRLGIPLDQTRFRTERGGVLYSRSATLDSDPLGALFENCGIRVLQQGSIKSDRPGWDPRPEVSWALGSPSSREPIL